MVNMNGTSYDELVRQQENIIAKINSALEAMSEGAPHGRDFVLNQFSLGGVRENIFRIAQGEHLQRMIALTQVRDDHAKILQFIVEAQIEKERMRSCSTANSDTQN
jgi:hypothetical protein